MSIQQKSNTSLLALRMDDVGASSKRYEVYSKSRVVFRGREIFSGNWLFFKYLPLLGAWGPYRELTAEDWESILMLLDQNSAKLTVGVTAAWVDSENTITPYPERYPRAAAVLKEGVEQGLVEIANHGLTHCIVDKNQFKPKLMRGNRQYHREFTENLPSEKHGEHLERAQEILNSYFNIEIVTLVPPGNQFTDDTLKAAAKLGMKFVSCNTTAREVYGLKVLDNQNTLPFHDRDIVRRGIKWFKNLLEVVNGPDLVFVRDLTLNTSYNESTDWGSN